MQTLKRGLCFQIGIWENINILTNPWVPYINRLKPVRLKNTQIKNEVTKVSELILPSREWKRNYMKTIFEIGTLNAIGRLRPPNQRINDKPIQLDDKLGNFSIKTA